LTEARKVLLPRGADRERRLTNTRVAMRRMIVLVERRGQFGAAGSVEWEYEFTRKRSCGRWTTSMGD
jgi:hypothetical protein